jgi:hypothetical protein
MKTENNIHPQPFFWRPGSMLGTLFLLSFLLTFTFGQDIKIRKPPIQQPENQLKIATRWAYARALNSVVHLGDAMNPELAEFRVTSAIQPITIAQINKVENALAYHVFYRPKIAPSAADKFWTMDSFKTADAALAFINQQGQYAGKPPKKFRVAGVTDVNNQLIEFLVLYAEVPGTTVPTDWRYKSFNTAQEVQAFLNQKSPLGDYVAETEVTTGGGKFHLFYRTGKIPSAQQWQFVKRVKPEEVVQFLNTGAGGQQTQTARIGAMKESLETFFYIFYK